MTTYHTYDIDTLPAPSDCELSPVTDADVLAAIDCDREASEMERQMREQVELMDAYAYQLGLCAIAERAGREPPYSATEQLEIRAQFQAAIEEHDWIEERYLLLYDARDERETVADVRAAAYPY